MQVDKIFKAAALAANSARIPLAKMAVEETRMVSWPCTLPLFPGRLHMPASPLMHSCSVCSACLRLRAAWLFLLSRTPSSKVCSRKAAQRAAP